MIQVNPDLIAGLLGPFIGLADDDDAFELYRSLDCNDEGQVKQLIRQHVRKNFNKYSEKGQNRIKLTLKYALSNNDFPFHDVYYGSLLPFDAPSNPRDFFVWIWEELFPDEDFVPMDITTVRIHADPSELNFPDMRKRNINE